MIKMKRWEAINECVEDPKTLKGHALGIFAEVILQAAGVDTEAIVLQDLEPTFERIESYLNEEVDQSYIDKYVNT